MRAVIEAGSASAYGTARTAVVRRNHSPARAARARRIAPCARSGIPDTGCAG